MDGDRVRQIARRNKRDKARQEASYAELVDVIWEMNDAGTPQVDIVKLVGLTRERVRQICDPVYRERTLKRRAATRLPVPPSPDQPPET